MIIRTKQGEFKSSCTLELLEFLGISKKSAGVQQVKDDVEIIANVPFRVKTETEEDKGFPWTLSTYDLDRYGERIDPKGWDFQRYMQNPIVQWAHRFDIPAIGKIDTLTVDEKGLHGLVTFNAQEYDQFGWSIGERVKSGVIRAGSVGFRALEIEIPSLEDSKDGTTLIFRKQELLEFSICNVPANPWALIKTNFETGETETKQVLGCPSFWGGIINTF